MSEAIVSYVIHLSPGFTFVPPPEVVSVADISDSQPPGHGGVYLVEVRADAAALFAARYAGLRWIRVERIASQAELPF